MKTPLNKKYWETRYLEENTGWDIGYASPALTAYAAQLRSKNLRVLIPGAGYGHEALYLIKHGFSDVTVIDLSTAALIKLRKKAEGKAQLRIIEGDFFELQHTYDLILEQTFFCALPPEMRTAYAKQAHDLLAPGGKIAGLLFDFPLTQAGPPFGGSKQEYVKLFSKAFSIQKLEPCYNSITPRAGKELFFIFEKK